MINHEKPLNQRIWRQIQSPCLIFSPPCLLVTCGRVWVKTGVDKTSDGHTPNRIRLRKVIIRNPCRRVVGRPYSPVQNKSTWTCSNLSLPMASPRSLWLQYGGFLKWWYPSHHPFLDRIFHYQSTSYWGTSISGNPQKGCKFHCFDILSHHFVGLHTIWLLNIAMENHHF